MSRYRFELARPADDAQLRGILAATPMAGDVSVSFRREPSFFTAPGVDGPFRQIVIGRDCREDRIVGFGSRAVREMYVNGRARPVGYLSSLRVLEEYRNFGLVARGYAYFRRLHEDARARLYLTTIAEGNRRAISILTSGRAGLPRYHFAGLYHTVAIPIGRRVAQSFNGDRSFEVRLAEPGDVPRIVEFLNCYGPRRQWFPRYEQRDFFEAGGTFHDLQPADVMLAFRNGELIGTLGGWDQHRFRQAIVEGYGGRMRWVRPLYNGWAKLRGLPTLPNTADPFRYLVAAIPVVAGDDSHVFGALLGRLIAHAADGPCAFLMLGLSDGDPLLPFALRHRATSYVTRTYHVCWEDGEELRESLDARPPYLELGCL